MLRALTIAAAVLAPAAILAPQPAAAAAAFQERERCNTSAPAQRRRSVLGGVLGGLAGSALGRAGVPGVAGLSVPVGSLLSDAIISLLDCKEQEQAAEATNEAVRGGVGTTATWESESRPGVSGASTVTADDRLADGSHCMTVTDIVIVDGEETRAPKRMCREPGASGYVRV